LQRHYPRVADQLFLNLSQTEGAEVVVSVGTFIERMAQMAEGAEPYGPEGPEARALLARRGLTAERVAEAEAQLDQLGTIREQLQPQPTAEEQEQAGRELWAWYLEWSSIARAAIRDRRLLRTLGFLQSRRSSASDVEDGDDALVDEDDSDEPDAPVAAPGAAPVPASTNTPAESQPTQAES
jgi:hypothetical protein